MATEGYWADPRWTESLGPRGKFATSGNAASRQIDHTTFSKFRPRFRDGLKD
jgi:hypothetical protein